MKLSIFSSSVTCLVLAAAACGGGGSGKAASESTAPEAAPESSGAVVSNETMDEIRRALDRKRNVVARCLTPAIDAGELPKNARGRMTLQLTIEPGGKAGEVKVIKTSIESKTVEDCVIARVHEIEFPAVESSLPWSYTYGFEAM